MPNHDEIRLTSGFTVEERKNFRAKLDKFASQAASDYSHPLEAVVQEIRYWQQSTSRGRTNPKVAFVPGTPFFPNGGGERTLGSTSPTARRR